MSTASTTPSSTLSIQGADWLSGPSDENELAERTRIRSPSVGLCITSPATTQVAAGLFHAPFATHTTRKRGVFMNWNRGLTNHGAQPAAKDESPLRRLLRLLAGRIARRLLEQGASTNKVNRGLTINCGHSSKRYGGICGRQPACCVADRSGSQRRPFERRCSDLRTTFTPNGSRRCDSSVVERFDGAQSHPGAR